MNLRRYLIPLASGIATAVVVLLAVLRPFLCLLFRKRPVSIWTGAPIINMAINARAERLLGVRSVSLVNYTYYITAQFDIVLARILPFLWWRRLAPYLTFIGVCLVADRVHAYCDAGVLPVARHLSFNRVELFVYRILGIRVFLWTYGADVRSRNTTRNLGEPNCCTDCPAVGKSCICDDAAWQENYAYLKRNATAIFAMGDMIEYTPGSRNDLFFWPVDLARNEGAYYQPTYPDDSPGRPLRVVHAPNHRAFKGTRYLEAAVKQLRGEGVPIDLVLVENVPNEQALAIYRTADVVFDQCLVGFHGYFAIEAMALGKPVICFIRHPERYLLHANECPILNHRKIDLVEALRGYATADRRQLTEIGRKSRQYVEKYFSLEAFAGRLNNCYADLGLSK